MKKQKPSTHLPSDDFTPTMGSNYGLDGYDFFEDYNEGVLDRARLPEARGLSALPDGIVSEDQDPDDVPVGVVRDEDAGVGDLEEIGLVSTKQASLADFSWLENSVQDPDRLPHLPHHSIEQLEKAWGLRWRTDGIRFLPNKEKEFLDEQSSEPLGKTASEFANVVGRAIRRATFGDSLKEIVAEAKREMGGATPRLKKALRLLREDFGLIGKIFIRASVFPGCANGKESRAVAFVTRKAQNARYAVKKEACGGCVHNHEGNCAIFKKALVDQVPWKRALNEYAPKLQAAGYRIASADSPKEVLRRTLASMPEGASSQKVLGHKEHIPSDQFSVKEAQDHFDKMPEQVPETVNVKDRQEAAIRQRVLGQVSRWVQACLLTKEDAQRLAASSAPPKTILKTASNLVTMTKQAAAYQGEGEVCIPLHIETSRTAAFDRLRKAEVLAQKRQEHVDNTLWSRMSQRIASLVKGGQVTKQEYSKLLKLDRSPDDILRLAFALIAKKAREVILPTSKCAGTKYGGIFPKYQGEGIGAIPKTPEVETEFAWGQIQEAEDPHKEIEFRLAAREREILQKKIGSLVGSKLLSESEAQALLQRDESLEETLRLASAVIAQRQMMPAPLPKSGSAPVSVYLGDGQRAEPQFKAGKEEARQLLKEARKQEKVSDHEIGKVVKWASVQLNEGSAGSEFDQITSARFSKPILKASKKALKELRQAHEGLAGHLYVDVSVYASPAGVSGCEKGAARHRANPIELVLAMDRCGSCVHNNADGVCQKYNKKLAEIEQPHTQGLLDYQQEMIRQSDAPDHEQTQLLFGTAPDPRTEFGLVASSLESIEFDNAPSHEDLGEILFGGIDLSEKG